MKNNKVSQVGRPSFQLKYPRGAFTVNDLIEVNPKVCALTCRQHVSKGLRSKFLKKMKETVQSGKAGKPAFKYIQAKVLAGIRKNRKNRKNRLSNVEVSTEAPATQLPVNTSPEIPAVDVPLTNPATIMATITEPVVSEAVPV
jgi:hypothetical protein